MGVTGACADPGVPFWDLAARSARLLVSRLSPRWGFSAFFPWLAPWAAFLRRFAALRKDADSAGVRTEVDGRLSKNKHYPVDNAPNYMLPPAEGARQGEKSIWPRVVFRTESLASHPSAKVHGRVGHPSFMCDLELRPGMGGPPVRVLKSDYPLRAAYRLDAWLSRRIRFAASGSLGPP
jgi:hypothetical protein